MSAKCDFGRTFFCRIILTFFCISLHFRSRVGKIRFCFFFVPFDTGVRGRRSESHRESESESEEEKTEQMRSVERTQIYSRYF